MFFIIILRNLLDFGVSRRSNAKYVLQWQKNLSIELTEIYDSMIIYICFYEKIPRIDHWFFRLLFFLEKIPKISLVFKAKNMKENKQGKPS